MLWLDLQQSYLYMCSEEKKKEAFVWWNVIWFSSMQPESSQHYQSRVVVEAAKTMNTLFHPDAHPGGEDKKKGMDFIR